MTAGVKAGSEGVGMEDGVKLQGAGAMREAFAAADWAKSPVGSPASWSPALNAALALMLPAQAQIAMFWGPEFVAFYNEAYAPTIGLKHPAALGRPARENWAELWADLEPLLAGVRETGRTISAKDRPFYIERSGHGETVYFDISFSAVRETDGEVGGVLCIVSETTARVVAQRQLITERERLAQLFEQAPSFMALLEGPEHRFALANPAYRQLLGRNDLVGRTVSEAAPEVVAQGFVDLLDKVYASGEPFRGRAAPLELVHEEGAPPQLFHLDFVYQPIKDATGAVTGIFVEGSDVTEAVRAAGDLAESEEKFRSFAQTAPNMFWTAKPDGQIDYANDQSFLYAGWPAGSLKGASWVNMLHPDDRAPVRERWEHALRTGKPYEVEFRLRRHDGVYRWHLARAAPIRDAEGRVRRWVGSNTDIQDQKDVAATLADVNAMLEARVEEHSRQLLETEEALRQSQKMEAVGQLTGGIAHDFNNLLQAISGSLDRVRRRIAEGRLDDVERFLKAAEEGASRAASLTHRLLAFSRRQTLDPRPTDVNRLVADMADLINRTVGPAIDVEVAGAIGLWTTRIDVSQLENALLNLCINARDAMPQGGRLIIETANRWLDDKGGRARNLPPGQYVSLSVTDTGVGMPKEVIDRAFDPFFTTKPIGQGTGLGLSMIYGFVRQSGGHVRIYSEVGQGTTVTIYLPRHLGEAERPSAHDQEQMEQGFGETVLVVDDEDHVRMLVTEVLSESAYRTLEARDGRTALEILESDVRIDLLVSDVGLPGGMNGRQLADAAREKRPGLKVLFITGYAENAVVGAGHLPHGMAVLVKPFAMAALGAKIRDILEG
jgi:PAS domain S-box-containing protein